MTEDNPEERLNKINNRLTELAKTVAVDPGRKGPPADDEVDYCLKLDALRNGLAEGKVDRFEKFFAFRCPHCSVVYCFTRHPPDVKVILEWLDQPNGCAMLCARCGKESRYTAEDARAFP